MALPLLHACHGATWMTVGDGNYGSDANFLARRGGRVVATSITDKTLKVARSLGYVEAIRAENAESLTPKDDAFDFVFCKEAYHHFPRAPIAFYEMLRVARMAVVLIEPADGPERILDRLRAGFKRMLRGDASLDFEPSGNFIFRLDIREVSKMVAASGYAGIAWLSFNDFYHPASSRGEYRLLSPRTWLLRLGIAVQDLFCGLRLMRPGLACVIAFKERPEASVRTALRMGGFRFRSSPINPYANTPDSMVPPASGMGSYIG
ncbi:MAG: class I SAM-dependent methyltransferase [Fibrobacteres bacterium]|nr:class I SAM-dependent methyltransferase [Fibrobacterota bacterium]